MTGFPDNATPDAIRRARAIVADPARHPADEVRRAAIYALAFDPDPDHVDAARQALMPTPRKVVRRASPDLNGLYDRMVIS